MIQCIIDTSLISELISLSELMTEFLGQIFGPNFGRTLVWVVSFGLIWVVWWWR